MIRWQGMNQSWAPKPETSLTTLVQINFVVSVKVLGQKVKNQLIMTAAQITKVRQNRWNLK